MDYYFLEIKIEEFLYNSKESNIRREFNIPENLIPVCLLPMGYKSDSCVPGPMHNVRKTIDEIVEYK